MPLPPIDLYDFAKAIEKRIWDGIFSMENPGRPWWERTGTAIWLAILRTAREYRVPVRFELSRMMQSACLYDHMAARLWPRVRLLKELRRYRDAQHRREAKVAVRQLQKRGVDRAALGAQAQKVLGQVGLQLEALMDNLPLRYTSVIQKAEYAASQLLRMLVTLVKVGAGLTLLRVLFVWSTSRRLDVGGAGRWVVSHALFYGIGLLLVVLTTRRVLFRLGDVDRRRR